MYSLIESKQMEVPCLWLHTSSHASAPLLREDKHRVCPLLWHAEEQEDYHGSLRPHEGPYSDSGIENSSLARVFCSTVHSEDASTRALFLHSFHHILICYAGRFIVEETAI